MMAKKGRHAESQEINLRQAWFILKHRLRLVIAITCGVATAVGVWTFQQTPMYEGHFKLLVGDPIIQKNATVNQELSEQLGINEVDYATQIEVLLSSNTLNPILKKIQTQYPNVIYKNLVNSEGKGLLRIEQLEETKILAVAYLNPDRTEIEFVLNQLADSYLRYSLEERQIQIKQGIKFVNDQLPQLRAKVNNHQEQLQAFRQTNNLLDPEQRSLELSGLEFALQEQYINLQVQIQEAQSLYTLLQQQLKLKPEDALVSSYLSESSRYQNLLNQLQEVEIELTQATSRYADEHPIILELKERRDKIIPLLQKEAKTVLGDRFTQESMFSDLTSPSQLRLNLNQQFIQTANQIEILKAKKLAMESETKDLQQQIRGMPKLARKYIDLQRELKVATESLNRFLEAQEKLQIEAAQQIVPWQLLSAPTVDDKPVWPRPARNLALGIIAGGLLGVGMAFLLERLDPVFHSVEDIKETTQLPILGMIPWQPDLSNMEKTLAKPSLVIGSDNRQSSFKSAAPRNSRKGYQSSGFLEAFSSLNTNIWLLGADHPIRSLVISSTTPADGKSTVSLQLAQAAAGMGQRVLLVDADLRRPRLHEHFGMLNSQGLSNVIATGLSPEEAIQQVPLWDNLWLLTAGDLPPDPIRLLTSLRMRELIEYWENSSTYDLVIYDTPPLLNFADARILGSATAGLIFVVKLGKTDRSAFKHVLDNLRLSQVPLLGLVANNITRNDYGGSSYYYYYRYGKR